MPAMTATLGVFVMSMGVMLMAYGRRIPMDEDTLDGMAKAVLLLFMVGFLYIFFVTPISAILD